uniref:CPXV160 protein n=1 Tax=Schistosoma curassoni TaxID=6186 RepID=A0A183JI67_9TREM
MHWLTYSVIFMSNPIIVVLLLTNVYACHIYENSHHIIEEL